jgi:hypothetical protein
VVNERPLRVGPARSASLRATRAVITCQGSGSEKRSNAIRQAARFYDHAAKCGGKVIQVPGDSAAGRGLASFPGTGSHDPRICRQKGPLRAVWSAQAPFSSTVNGAFFFGKHEKEWGVHKIPCAF